MGTDQGADRLDLQTGQLSHYSLDGNTVRAIYQDEQGTIWAGTNGGGLNRFDRQSGTFRAYREGDGLPNDVVYGILEDAAGRLWLSTNRGLSCFDPGTEAFQNYDADDGLQSDEFNAGAYYRNAAGRMFFGGINGFNAFYPEEIRNNSYIHPAKNEYAYTLEGFDSDWVEAGRRRFGRYTNLPGGLRFFLWGGGSFCGVNRHLLRR